MLQYIAISNISIFLSGILYCIAAIDIAIYQYIVILLHPLCVLVYKAHNTPIIYRDKYHYQDNFPMHYQDTVHTILYNPNSNPLRCYLSIDD